jgi:PAS domain S-box-containing protein
MLRLIFQSVGNGILLLSDEYRIVKANQRAGQIHACSSDELIGKDLRDLTDNHGRWTLMSCVGDLSGESRISAELQVRRFDGTMLPASFTVSRVVMDGRNFWSVIVRDISRQKALQERLRLEKQQVEEMNVTLRNVMKSVDSERKDFESKLGRRIRSHLLPALDRIAKEPSESIRASYLDLVREQLIGLTSGTASEIDANLLKLSKTEMRICQFIQAGCSTKDICEAMNLAFETVQTHRKNIRRKLGLRGKNVNLHSYLIGRRPLVSDHGGE